jgi:hypothetical protein
VDDSHKLGVRNPKPGEETQLPRNVRHSSGHRFVANLAQTFDLRVLFRYAVLAHASAVASLKQKILAEQTVRELLERNGLPGPDEVEYGYGCVRLLFHEPKTALIIDIDEPDHDDMIEPEEASLDADLN